MKSLSDSPASYPDWGRFVSELRILFQTADQRDEALARSRWMIGRYICQYRAAHGAKHKAMYGARFIDQVSAAAGRARTQIYDAVRVAQILDSEAKFDAYLRGLPYRNWTTLLGSLPSKSGSRHDDIETHRIASRAERLASDAEQAAENPPETDEHKAELSSAFYVAGNGLLDASRKIAGLDPAKEIFPETEISLSATDVHLPELVGLTPAKIAMYHRYLSIRPCFICGQAGEGMAHTLVGDGLSAFPVCDGCASTDDDYLPALLSAYQRELAVIFYAFMEKLE